MIYVMVDVETCGLLPSSRILTIGATVFSLAGGLSDPFYARLKAPDQGTFTTDASTMEWWSRQNPNVKAEAFEGVVSYRTGLLVLADYLDGLRLMENKALGLFANHSNFDFPMLEHSFRQYEIPVPWRYTEVYCYATLRNLLKNKIPVERGVKNSHISLEDAQNQARHCIKLLRYLF